MIILNPISSLLYIVCLGIDVTIFFLLVHLITTWRHVPWLAHFERIGRPLAEKTVAVTEIFLPKRICQSLSDLGRAAVGLTILSLCKYAIGALFAVSAG